MIAYDVFVSYSRKDRICADSIERTLSSGGLKTWMDRRNNRGGDLWAQEIDTALGNSEIVVLISSRDSNHSKWVRHEIEAALRLNRRIVPIQLGQDVPIEGVAEIVDRRGFHRIVTDAQPTAAELRSLLEDVRQQLNRPIPENIPPYGSAAFVGREEYLERLLHASDRVLLSGISGAGKTELALQFAIRNKQQFKGGIFVANCATSEFASELALFTESHLRLTVPDLGDAIGKIRWVWRNWNCVGQVLVIVNDPDTSTLSNFLPPRNSQFRVIVCSQEQELLGMERIAVDLLGEPASLALLSELLGAERANREIDAALDICRWSGGLPLALDAIGQYLRRNASDSLASYRDRLTSAGIDQVAFRENPGQTREKTLHRAFELSWARLSDRGKDLAWLFGKLAFAPVSKQFLRPLAADPGWDDLLHWNFLRPSGPEQYRIHHQRLYEFLATVRHPRSTRLMNGLLRALRGRARGILKPAAPDARAILAAPHLEHAASGKSFRANPNDCFLLLDAAAKCYEIQGLHKRVESAAQKAITCAARAADGRGASVSDQKVRDLKYRTSVAQIGQGFYIRARRGLEAIQANAKTRPLPAQLQRRVWSSLGDAARLLGRLVESADFYKRSLALARGSEQRSEELYRLARVERLLGNHDEARSLYAEAETSAPKGKQTHAYCLFGIAEIARLNRQYSAAGANYQASLQEFRQLGHREGEAYTLWGTGEVHRWQRNFAAALQDHERSEQLCLEVGDRRSQAWAILGAAEVRRAMGEFERSRLEYVRALHVLQDSRRTQDREPTELALAHLGVAASLRMSGHGDPKLLQFSCNVYRRQNMAYYQVQCLVERALSREPGSIAFKRDLALAEKICRAKSYRFELDEINRIRDRPDAIWIHELNPT